MGFDPRETAAWRAVAQTGGARFYWLAVGLGTALITTRYLGPDGRGVLAAAITWANLFVAFGSLSLPQVTLFFAGSRRNDPEWLGRITGTLLALVLVTSVVGWSVVAALVMWPNAAVLRHLPGPVIAAAFATLPFALWIEIGNALLIAKDRLRVVNAALVIGGSVSLGLTLVFVGALGFGAIGALAATGFGQVLTCVVGFAALRHDFIPLRFDPATARALLAGGARLHLNAIGTFLVMQSGVLVLNEYRGSAETAYYQLALQLMTAIQVLPLAASTVAYGIVTREGPDAGWSHHRRLVLQTLVAMLAVGAIAYVAAPLVIHVLAGADFHPAAGVFRTLLLGILGMTLANVMASQWIGRGFFLRVSLMSTVSGLAVVAANWLVIPRHGMYGAAWVFAAFYGISIAINAAFFLWIDRRVRLPGSPPAGHQGATSIS